MNFSEALNLIKKGKHVQRAGWNGKNMYLFYIDYWTYTNGVNDNYPNLPFIAMKTADNKVVPWLASQTDILAEDWIKI
jgi:hypothetical protein